MLTKWKRLTSALSYLGSGKDAGPYGGPMLRGFHLAREEINKARTTPTADAISKPKFDRLKFHVVDDESSAAGAKAAVEKLVGDELVEDGVPVIVGIAISTYVKEAFPVAQDEGVVAFSPVFFRCWSEQGAWEFRLPRRYRYKYTHAEWCGDDSE